jgi:hypothetical protein
MNPLSLVGDRQSPISLPASSSTTFSFLLIQIITHSASTTPSLARSTFVPALTSSSLSLAPSTRRFHPPSPFIGPQSEPLSSFPSHEPHVSFFTLLPIRNHSFIPLSLQPPDLGHEVDLIPSTTAYPSLARQAPGALFSCKQATYFLLSVYRHSLLLTTRLPFSEFLPTADRSYTPALGAASRLLIWQRSISLTEGLCARIAEH